MAAAAVKEKNLFNYHNILYFFEFIFLFFQPFLLLARECEWITSYGIHWGGKLAICLEGLLRRKFVANNFYSLLFCGRKNKTYSMIFDIQQIFLASCGIGLWLKSFFLVRRAILTKHSKRYTHCRGKKRWRRFWWTHSQCVWMIPFL